MSREQERQHAADEQAAITTGWLTSMPDVAACWKAANRASAVSAAEPMAKPLPIAAVVLPTASSLSVRCAPPAQLAISAMPPALSAIGP
jgi:hypothetical protein